MSYLKTVVIGFALIGLLASCGESERSPLAANNLDEAMQLAAANETMILVYFSSDG